MGAVYEAYDQERHETVALKTLRWQDPSAIYRLKKEFRVLSDIAHANLASLYELVADGDDWFYTMELVDGVEFFAYVRPAPPSQSETRAPPDVPRLRAALAQLIKGVVALHRAGIVHRDLKPSNVLVTPAGRVVILDFGLADVVAPPSPLQTREEGLWGTVAYMSPEQVEGQRSPASDWYAVGVMLYEALTGRLPFQGSALRVLADKGRQDPPRLSELVPELPQDLVPLCGDLMARDPAARPEAGEREAAALVLRGRCYERESVPYKAVDGVIDSLSRYLKTLAGPQVKALLPEGVSALARLFPVLLRIEAVGDARIGEREPADPLTLRQRGFACLRQLLVRLSAQQPVLVFIDDLQWADRDSMVLLEDVLRPPDPPHVLLIASFRTEDLASQPFLRALLEHADTAACRACRLGPLTSADTMRLTETLLVASSRAPTVKADTSIRESAGSPFLVEQMVRYALDSNDAASATGIGLGEMLESRIRALPEGARPLLDTLAVAGRPVDAKVARAAAGLEGDDRPLLALLIKAHFLRSLGAPSRLELYHDRMRETLVAALAPQVAAGIHWRLAQCSEELLGLEDPEALFEHYAAAGNRDRAAVYAARAADKAFAALAFDRAALLYERALELTAPGAADLSALRVRLGDALASAARCPAAAQAYLAAAAAGAPEDALQYQRRAAEQLLISGHLEAGLDVIRTVLRSVGLELAPTPRRAVLSLLWRRAAVRLRGLTFRERSVADIGARELARIDTCWAVAAGLALVDNLRAADFLARHLLLALRAGEPYRVARGLALEAAFTASQSSNGRRRAAQLIAVSRPLAERIQSQHALALCELASCVAAFYEGRWEHARGFAERAEQLLLECGGVPWELNTAQLYQTYACYFIGDFPELARRSRAFLSNARERGNRLAGFYCRSGFTNAVWLAADDVAGAERNLDEAVREWHQEEFGVPHYWTTVARAHILLYRGEPALAWDGFMREWPGLVSSGLLRVQGVRINMRDLRARCALAAAAGGADHAPLLAVAERDVGRLERERLAWADALALLLRAGLAAARGEVADVAPLLERATAAFDAAQMAVHAHVVRRRLGETLSGDEGRSLVHAADAWMHSQGIRNPARYAEILGPNLAPRERV